MSVREPPWRSVRPVRAAILVLAAALGFGVAPANAAITQPDLMVAGRAVAFVEGIGRGELKVGIVFAPESAQSVQQSNEIRAILGSQLRVGNLTLQPVMVRLDQVDTADVSLFLLTAGIGVASDSVAGVSRARKIPCITFDLAQQRRGACAIGVQTSPRIEIFLNRKAAAESSTILSSVFRLMVTEN